MNKFLSRLKIEPSIKKEIIFISLIILISTILRIPALIGPVNNDVWFIIWESRLLFEGHLNELIIHPLSIFGAYPFSSYPIGTLVTYRIFDLISFKNEFVGVNLYSIFFVTLSAIFSFKFFKYVFNEKNDDSDNKKGNYLGFIGSLLYINFPYMIYFSYNMASARFPVMAFIPLIMLYSLQAIRKNHFVPYLKSVSISIFMMLFHRMILPLLVVPILVGIYLLVQLIIKKSEKLTEKHIQLKKFVSKYFVYVFSATLIVMLLIGFVFFYFVYADIFTYGLDNKFLAYLVHVFAIRMYNGWGTLLFISAFGLVLLSSRFRIKTSTSYSNIQYSLLLLIPLMFFLSSPYDIYLIVIIPILLALHYMQHFGFENEGIKPIINAGLLVVFGVLLIVLNVSTGFAQVNLSYYFYILVIIGCFIILTGISILIAYLQTKITREKRIPLAPLLKQAPKIVPIVLVAGCMIFSRFYIDYQTLFFPNSQPDYFPSNHLTTDEKILANFLSSTPNTLFACVTRQAGIRISVLSGCYDLADAHSLSLLLSGYYTKDEVNSNATLKPFYLWWESNIYDLPDNMLVGRVIFQLLVESEANATTLAYVHELNLEYFITNKNSNMTEIHSNQWFASPFIQNIDNIATVVFTTDLYYLWSFD
ncbi:MAG: hypothetical protein ACTSP7_04985 [Candidatus Heimdallarchaeota archaeon]